MKNKMTKNFEGVYNTAVFEKDEHSNVTAFSINTNGSYNAGGQALPSIANNAGSGITGDIYIENDAACIGTVIIKCKKVSGWDNIT